MFAILIPTFLQKARIRLSRGHEGAERIRHSDCEIDVLEREGTEDVLTFSSLRSESWLCS